MPEKLKQIIAERIIDVKKDDLVYKPQFFRLTNEKDKQDFKALLENDSSIKLYNSINDQLVELIKIIHVTRKLQPEEIAGLITEHLSGIDVEEYGVWVYYPWLKNAIHILDETEFIQVRTNRNQHKITASEIKILQQKKIGVIGLSVGQTIASTLVLERVCGEIRLADFDDIQLSNLNRINTSLSNISVLKVIQIAREISEVDPFIKVSCFSKGIIEENIDEFLLSDGKIDVLIEECDSIDIKILARIKAKEYGIPVVMDTNDRGMIDIERYDLMPDYPLLHGLLGNVPSPKNLKNLPLEQSLPIFMKFFAIDNVSARAKVTLIELGQTVSTWPQIASSVVLGGALVTDVTRRILLNQLKISGRFYIDIEDLIKQQTKPVYTPPILHELSEEDFSESLKDLNSNAEKYTEVDIKTIENIVSDAGTAPSSGNDQPWKFVFKNNSLYLFHEASRSYSFGDYKNMASYISLGTALENAVLSAHHFGKEVSVNILPKKDDLKFIAAINFITSNKNSTETHAYDDLYKSIHLRCTNRKIEPNEPADDYTLQQLKNVTESVPGANVFFITDKEVLKKLGKIISAGDRIRIMNPRAHHEFFNREIHWNTEQYKMQRTGMDVHTMELDNRALLALKTVSDEKVMNVLRDINGMQAFKNVSLPNAINSAAMGLVTMPSFTPEDFVNGGRVVERQWLKATEMGYGYHPMVIPLYLFYRMLHGGGEGLNNEVIAELGDMRKEFMEIFPGKEMRGEIFLFRIFKADEVKERTLRLPLSKILKTDAN